MSQPSTPTPQSRPAVQVEKRSLRLPSGCMMAPTNNDGCSLQAQARGTDHDAPERTRTKRVWMTRAGHRFGPVSLSGVPTGTGATRRAHWSCESTSRSSDCARTNSVIWKDSRSRNRLFIEKVRDIVGLYLHPPERAVVLPPPRHHVAIRGSERGHRCSSRQLLPAPPRR